MICSLALAKLRTDIRGDLSNNNAVGMAQKLLLFWRKPARRCWWEGVDLNDVEGVEGQVKVWIRRVWTLEMVRLLLFQFWISVYIANRSSTECYWLAVISSLFAIILIHPLFLLSAASVPIPRSTGSSPTCFCRPLFSQS